MAAALKSLIRTLVVLAVASLAAAPAAAQEVTTLRVAKQYGLALLQLMLMEDQKLVEKHAQRLGHPGLATEWTFLRSSDIITDGLLSGSLDIATFGLPSLVLLNERTRGRLEVRGLVGFNTVKAALVTRNPAVKTIADFGDSDKIAVPAIKVSNQAILLQMAAAKLWGDQQWQRLDRFTVSMSHPDATVAMLSGRSEITASFPSPPFLGRQLKDPAIRVVMTQEEILGSASTAAALATTTPFRERNPTVVKALIAAFEEATDQINQDKRKAAESYARIASDRTPIEELVEMMTDSDERFTLKLMGIEPWVTFVSKIGMVKQPPARWQDIFFPEAFRGAGG